MNTCLHCKEEYKPKRATSKYCSDKCRVQASRVSVTEDSVTPLSVTGNATLTDNTLKPIKTCSAMYDVCSSTSTQEERDMFSKVLDHYIDSYT